MKEYFIYVIVVLSSLCLSLKAEEFHLNSIDSNIEITIHTGDVLSWSVSYKSMAVLLPARIDIRVNRLENSIKSQKAIIKSSGTIKKLIKPVVANKSSTIPDEYNLLVLELNPYLSVEFRAYNNGVAYRFHTNFENEIEVLNEVVELIFPESTVSYFPEEKNLISHNERLYQYVNLDTIGMDRFASLPVLMKVKSVNLLFTEADLFDYPVLFLSANGSNSLKGKFPKYILKTKPKPGGEDRDEIVTEEAEYIARTAGKRTFPWRLIIISDQDADLITNNLVYQLSRPLQLSNTNWIRPGKVTWDWYNANNIYSVNFKSGLNTETYKYYIDFAAKYNIEYIILDEGWSKSTTNVLEFNPQIDVKELIAYGEEKNVNIILWLLWKPLDQNLEEILKTYHDWGAKGVKVDFMQRGDQYMVNFYERVAKEAARQRLLIDFHGSFKPAGLRRAYPNVLSYEGVKGNENNKWSDWITPEHNLTIPFIRMAAGPMDYTPGAMSNAQKENFNISFYRPASLGTRCHQIAMYVIYESPLQMLCDSPSAYLADPITTQFIAQIPVTWDETLVLKAKLGDYLIIARKNGTNWYLGAMTDWTSREFEIDLSFLDNGKYAVEIMEDGKNASRFAEDYVYKTIEVNSSSTLKINMVPGGGWAAVIKLR